MKPLYSAVAALLGSTTLLLTSLAHAIPGYQIVIGKDTASNSIAVYRRSPNNVCLPKKTSPGTAWIAGSPFDDVIVVVGQNETVNFCGNSIKSIVPSTSLYIWGEFGSDAIWVGNTDSRNSIWVTGGTDGGRDYSDDNASNSIYIAGSSRWVKAGGRGDYIVALAGAFATGDNGTDMFCTGVPGVSLGTATSVDGRFGNDYRIGPAPGYPDLRIEGTSTDTSLCSSIYLHLQNRRAGILN